MFIKKHHMSGILLIKLNIIFKLRSATLVALFVLYRGESLTFVSIKKARKKSPLIVHSDILVHQAFYQLQQLNYGHERTKDHVPLHKIIYYFELL